MELGNLEALKSVVATGLGYGIVSRLAVEHEAENGRLVAIPLKPRLSRRLSVILPKDRFRSRLVSTFTEFAKQRLRERSM